MSAVSARSRSLTIRLSAGLGLAAMLVVLGSETLQTAAANGDTRTISFRNTHTSEELTVTYKRDGRYVPEAMKQINHILRDWRRDEATEMDPRLIDTVWEVHRELNARAPIWIISGYRAPATNNMLRTRSSGVAENSQHTHGRAMDFFIPGVPLADIRAMGLRMQRGGVGFYPTSGSPFVHLDVGSVRHWPRMTYDQLARIFPDGRTVHIPSNGKPLPNYQLALADIQKRGGSPSRVALASAGGADTAETGGRPLGDLIASLFNRGDGQPAAAPTRVAAVPARETPAGEAAAKETGARTQASARAAVPLPPPAPRLQLAAAALPEAVSAPLPPPRPARPAEAAAPVRMAAATVLPLPAQRAAGPAPAGAPQGANAIIESRGYWQGLPEPQMAAVTAAVARKAQRTAAAAARPQQPPELPALMRGDRAPPSDLALAYAPHVEPERPAAPKAPAVVTTAAIPPNTTVAAKRTRDRPSAAIVSAALPAAAVTRVGDRLDNPWMRAMVVTGRIRTDMSITALGMLSPAHLAPLMHKPAVAVMTGFADDPAFGLGDARFTGEAVVFVRTVTFGAYQRSAALR